MVNDHQSIVITDLRLELVPTGQRRSPFAPAIHAGHLHISTMAFRHIVSNLLIETFDLPIGKLAFVDCGWQPGGAWLTMQVRSFIQQNVTLKVALSAASSGNLSILLLDVRAGLLPLNRMLDPLLDQIVRRPGFARTGPMEVELNVAELLRAHDIPITMTAKIRNVRTDTKMAILEMGQ